MTTSETFMLVGGILVGLAALGGALGLFVSLVMVFFKDSRGRAGRVAMWSGLVLVASAGICAGYVQMAN